VARVLDIYPDVMRAHPRLRRWRIVHQLWGIANRFAYRRCACIVTLGDVMASTLSRYTTRASVVIPDWSTIVPTAVPPRESNPMRAELGLGNRLTILYSGNIGLTHDLSTLVDAATQFGHDDRLRFVIIGEGPQHDRLRLEANRRQTGHLFLFLPRQTPERLPLSMGLGDLSIVTIAGGAESTCMPCKTYDYLAAGSAILAIVRRPSDLAALVDAYRCGVVIAPGDVGGLVAAIRDALSHNDRLRQMRAAARRAATDVFSAEVQCTRLVDLLERQAGELNTELVLARSR
jgi:glycosyltransferase involved in cell wall biosynthesis